MNRIASANGVRNELAAASRRLIQGHRSADDGRNGIDTLRVNVLETFA